MSSASPLLELRSLAVRAGDDTLLRGVDLEVHETESVGLVLERGRTSFLEAAAGLREPAEGQVLYRGKPLRKELAKLHRGPRIGFVFEEGGLLENATLYDNIALPLRYHTMLREAEIERRVMAALSLVEIEEWRNRFPFQVTRGAIRLASLARALVREPELVYLDDFLHGGTAELWEDFVRAMGWARREHGTAFLAGLAGFPEDGAAPMLDRVLEP